MDLGWNTAIQAVVLAVCTWYMRQGSKADSASLKRTTAAQSTSTEILDRVKDLEIDLALVKQIALKNQGIDHRGPSRT